MERNKTTEPYFRTKLLTAACQMQSALSIQDLGQLYHKPLRDNGGTTVIACINNVKVSKGKPIEWVFNSCCFSHFVCHKYFYLF